MSETQQPNTPAPVENDEVKSLKAKIEEFRNGNRELHKKIEETNSKYKEVDLDEYTRLKAGQTQAKSAEVLELERKYQRELAAEKTARQELETTLNHRTLESELARQAQTLGVKGDALEDFIARGEKAFKVAGGKVVSAKDDGVTPEEWAKELRKKASHLFTKSTGGNARGSSGTASEGRLTLTAKQAANPTEEQRKAIAANLVDYSD
jgi:predicted nuclease with TOPRIM domain